MATVTLTTLLTRVRERADMANSQFVTDARLTDWVNEAHAKLHGMVVDALGEEYISLSSAFTTVTDQSDYTLPVGFYKLYGVDLFIQGDYRALQAYNRTERNAYRNSRIGVSRYGWYLPRYSLVGNALRIYPVQAGGLSGTILYAPEASVLVGGSDTVSYPNGWERFIVLDAAIQALAKEESDVRTLASERDAVMQEIERTKENRDLATPQRVVDVSMVDAEFW